MSLDPSRNQKNRCTRWLYAWLLCAPCVVATLVSLPSCSSDSGGPASAYGKPPPPATRVVADSNTVNWTSDDASSAGGPVFQEEILLPADGIALSATSASALNRVLAAANGRPNSRIELRPRVENPDVTDDATRGMSRAIEISAYLADGGVEPGRVVALPVESNTSGGRGGGYPEHVEVVMVTEPPAPAEVSYYWNAWADPLDSSAAFAAPSYEPTQYLKPGDRYLLNVHLSGLEYKYAGVKRFAVEQRLRETLDEGVATPSVHDVTFKVVLLTDERAFNTPSKVVGDFKVNIDKIRGFMAAGQPGSPNPMSVLEKGRDPDFLFGRLPEVELQTSGATGSTAIGLSFWLDGRPYAEISIPFCVRGKRDNPCPEDEVATTSFGGSGLLDAAGESGAGNTLPDAALHVVELSPSKLVGIFHRADGGGAPGAGSHFVWSIKESAQAFTKQLAQLQDQFGKIETAPTPIGKDFKNLLFDGNGNDVQQAKVAFEGFFATNRGATPFENPDPATIFVRMVLQDLPRPWLYPLGLLNVDGTNDGFLGYHLRVETPLPRQSYGQAPSCLSSWVPVLPVEKNDPPLIEALVEVSRGDRLLPGFVDPTTTTYRVVTGRQAVKPLQNMTEFHAWLGQDDSPAGSSILSVLSHHDNESLFFAANGTHINPSSVRRPLPGSVAVLSGCSTGQFGSAGIVRALNERGVDSIISTNTGITGRLAGDFVDCLSRAIEGEPSGSEIPVGDAFSKAQRCLYSERATLGPDAQSLYGHLVLSFTLAGNPNIPLCGPE